MTWFREKKKNKKSYYQTLLDKPEHAKEKERFKMIDSGNSDLVFKLRRKKNEDKI